MAGDEVTGASTFLLEEGLDTGPVFGVVTDTIGPTDTAGDLLARLATAGAGLLVATLDGLEAGALVPVAQSPDGVSLAPKIRVEDARVIWTDPGDARRPARARVHPGARCVDPVPRRADQAGPGATGCRRRRTSGRARSGWSRNSVLVGTATHAVLLGDVRAEGKRLMAAGDWARGVRVEPGERLG